MSVRLFWKDLTSAILPVQKHPRYPVESDKILAFRSSGVAYLLFFCTVSTGEQHDISTPLFSTMGLRMETCSQGCPPGCIKSLIPCGLTMTGEQVCKTFKNGVSDPREHEDPGYSEGSERHTTPSGITCPVVQNITCVIHVQKASKETCM